MSANWVRSTKTYKLMLFFQYLSNRQHFSAVQAGQQRCMFAVGQHTLLAVFLASEFSLTSEVIVLLRSTSAKL